MDGCPWFPSVFRVETNTLFNNLQLEDCCPTILPRPYIFLSKWFVAAIFKNIPETKAEIRRVTSPIPRIAIGHENRTSSIT